MESKRTLGLFDMRPDMHQRDIGPLHAYVSGAPFKAGDADPLYHAEFCGPNQEDDARLYIAAPYMLATLERWARWFEQTSNPDVQGIACDTFAAIKKARGE